MISTDDNGQCAMPSIRVAEVFPGVVISNRGDVWGRTPSKDAAGYASIRVNYVLHAVHRLVAESFVPRGGAGDVVCHLNDKKDDNRASNLCWGTHADNAKMSVLNGGRNALLTVDTVKEARSRAHDGESPATIADAWGLPRQVVYDAVRGVTWASVTEPPPIPNKERKFGYTASIRDWAVTKYREGVSSSVVAREIGCDPKTVRNWAAA